MSRILEEGKRTPSEKAHSKQAANIFSGLGQQSSSSSSLPKGVVLDKDGKPCRTCTSSAAWMAMMKSSTKNPSDSTGTNSPQSPLSSKNTSSSLASIATLDSELQPPPDCPPDVEALGRSSWTLLHSLPASYPPNPDISRQRKTQNFLTLFSQLYPCWVCAEDFQEWMKEPENDVAVALKSQETFGRWMCRAHNAVNVKLGKDEFNCDLWRERWKDGWKDGRCD